MLLQGATGVAAVKSLYQGLPRLCRILIIVLGSFWLVSLLPSSKDFLALVPARTLPPYFYLWNLVTCAFFEASFVQLVLDCTIVATAGAYLETVWGVAPFVKFIGVCITGTSCLTIVWFTVVWIFTGEYRLLMEHPVCGFSGVVMSFLVAVKQAMPERELSGPVTLPIRFKYLPLAFLLLSLSWKAVGFGFHALPLVVGGAWVAWAYLRFFKKAPNGQVGDAEAAFALATFFPTPVHPLINTVTRPMSRIGAMMGFRPPVQPSEDTPSYYGSLPPGGDPASLPPRETARRHVDLAQHVLAQRMALKGNEHDASADAEANGDVVLELNPQEQSIGSDADDTVDGDEDEASVFALDTGAPGADMPMSVSFDGAVDEEGAEHVPASRRRTRSDVVLEAGEGE